MPAMLRIPGRPTKIAFRILGVPANLKSKLTKAQQKINDRLVAEETVRVR